MKFIFRFIRSLFYRKEEKDLFIKVSKLLSIYPSNITLYKVAFQYQSSKNSNFSNERLEFLGDAALSLIIGNYLFRKYPQSDEGFLTDVRSRVVNRETMGHLASKMGIQHLLQHDSSSGRSRHTYGNALEALIGAIYLDLGYNRCYEVVMNMFKHYSDFDYILNTEKNFKSLLYEWANKKQREIEIKILEKFEVGEKIFFRSQVLVSGKVLCVGEGRAKKESEQNAARKALDMLQEKNIEEHFLNFQEANTINMPIEENENEYEDLETFSERQSSIASDVDNKI